MKRLPVSVESYNALRTWVTAIKQYPPATIFFEKYGKEAKAEERIKDLCEELYRFMYPDNQKNILGDLGASFRELEVIYMIGLEGMKEEYVQSVKNRFLEDAKIAVQACDTFFKKDQLLQKYYEERKMKFQDIRKYVYDI